MTKLKPSDVFAKCIENIETWGWTQNKEMDYSTGACCARGHIRFAAGLYIDVETEDHPYDYVPVFNADYQLVSRCTDIFMDAIGGDSIPAWGDSIPAWNDQSRRTKKQVVAAFQKAYDLALSKGE
jgi:hypothetical protein